MSYPVFRHRYECAEALYAPELESIPYEVLKDLGELDSMGGNVGELLELRIGALQRGHSCNGLLTGKDPVKPWKKVPHGTGYIHAISYLLIVFPCFKPPYYLWITILLITKTIVIMIMQLEYSKNKNQGGRK